MGITVLLNLYCQWYFFSSWQTALKLLVKHDEELLKLIPVLLGCKKENVVEGNFVEMSVVSSIVDLMKETAYSHLMEVSNLSAVLFIFVFAILFISFVCMCLHCPQIWIWINGNEYSISKRKRSHMAICFL